MKTRNSEPDPAPALVVPEANSADVPPAAEDFHGKRESFVERLWSMVNSQSQDLVKWGHDGSFIVFDSYVDFEVQLMSMISSASKFKSFVRYLYILFFGN